MAERSNVILRFKNDIGRAIHLTIPRADLTLTPARAQATMEAMIACGIIVRDGGFPDSIIGAEIVTTQRVPLVAP